MGTFLQVDDRDGHIVVAAFEKRCGVEAFCDLVFGQVLGDSDAGGDLFRTEEIPESIGGEDKELAGTFLLEGDRNHVRLRSDKGLVLEVAQSPCNCQFALNSQSASDLHHNPAGPFDAGHFVLVGCGSVDFVAKGGGREGVAVDEDGRRVAHIAEVQVVVDKETNRGRAAFGVQELVCGCQNGEFTVEFSEGYAVTRVGLLSRYRADTSAPRL